MLFIQNQNHYGGNENAPSVQNGCCNMDSQQSFDVNVYMYNSFLVIPYDVYFPSFIVKNYHAQTTIVVVFILIILGLLLTLLIFSLF